MRHYLLAFLLFPLFFFGQGFGDNNYHRGYIVNKGCFLFYEMEENVLLAPVLIEFDSSINLDKVESLINYHNPNGTTDTALIKILAKKNSGKNFECDGLFYEKLLVKEITSDTFTLYDFIFTKGHIKRELEEDFEGEGFYSKGMEHSAFTVLKDGKLESGGWVEFAKDIQEIDSLKDVTQHRSPEMARGVYMKVKGTIKYGDYHGYGHFGSSSYLLHVSKILAVDTTKTRFNFINQKIKDDGLYIRKYDTLKSPRLPQQGKEYLLKGNFGRYRAELKLKRSNNTDINYTLEYFKGKKLVEKISGLLSASPNYNNEYYYQSGGEFRYTYESNDDKYKHGRSLLTFIIYDLPGKTTFSLEDEYSNAAQGRYIDLIEVKKE